MTRPSISVVIPTLNAADRLPSLVGLLRTQSLAPDEVLVVDSSSEDGTAGVARSLGVECVVIDRSEFNHGTTRHKALLSTGGDYVCFMTDDAVPANDRYVENLVAPLADPSVAMVSGRQLPKDDARRFEQLVRGFNYGPESNVRGADDLSRLGIKTYFATDVCSVYRRTAYLQVGGFARCDTNEDMLIAAAFVNAGMRVAYAADAEVYHSHNLTPRQQYRRNRAVGRFLEEHAEDLLSAGEVGEGMRLVKQVSLRLMKERRAIELAAFGLDCAARLLGNRAGRRDARREREGKR